MERNSDSYKNMPRELVADSRASIIYECMDWKPRNPLSPHIIASNMCRICGSYVAGEDIIGYGFVSLMADHIDSLTPEDLEHHRIAIKLNLGSTRQNYGG